MKNRPNHARDTKSLSIRQRKIPEKSRDLSSTSRNDFESTQDDGQIHQSFVHLPTELILLILDYIPREPPSQKTLWALGLINRTWYNATVRRLYEQPLISGQNYHLFVRTVCPSINASVRKSPLAGFVQVLDLGHLIYHSSKSLTARLLGRTKPGLRYFRAPQASFAINACAALAKCTELRALDLSLVSESPSLITLSRVLASLSKLESFAFPRSSPSSQGGIQGDDFRWPPRLRQLLITGGVGDWFLRGITRAAANIPSTLTELKIEHCPHITRDALTSLLIAMGDRLTRLSISNMPALTLGSLNELLGMCTILTHLSVSVDFVRPGFANLETLRAKYPSITIPHPLTNLDITRASDGWLTARDQIGPRDLYTAIEDGLLTNLRCVRFDGRTMQWQGSVAMEIEVEKLDVALQLSAIRSKKRDTEFGLVGVWKLPENEYQLDAPRAWDWS